jgi:hypothetical protein
MDMDIHTDHRYPTCDTQHEMSAFGPTPVKERKTASSHGSLPA